MLLVAVSTNACNMAGSVLQVHQGMQLFQQVNYLLYFCRNIQDGVPNARVLYSSATGASEPNNLAYMVRLGSFGCAVSNLLVGSPSCRFLHV